MINISSSVLYNANILPTLIPSKIFSDIKYKGYSITFQEKKFENYPYKAIYFNVNFLGKDLIIEINNLFNKSKIAFTEKDMNVFIFGIISVALVFIIIFSTILANQISLPIRKLTNAMRSIGGGDLTIEIKGNYVGEISELIDGFNKMVEKIRISQIEIAKLERESAWREMAKQVAHEIKNPLTPIKLSIQQLIAAQKDKSPKFEEIFNKVTTTIINQIEVLKNIATEFSNFARMPKVNLEKIDLRKTINKSLNLFTDERLSINFIMNEDIFVYADEDHFNRTIINLIRNSIQAKAKYIFICADIKEKFCNIRVKDDGEGIPLENVEKVFDENFTTKKMGMGLGLSMAKKFLTSIGGNIEIESTSPKGTTFLIKIPLAD